VGSSFTRSEIVRLSGGRTRWSGAVVGLVILAFLPFANVLATLPRAILGAIVMYSAARFLRFRTLVRIGWLSRPQALVAWVTFALSLLLAPRIDRAVMIGIGLAIIVHLWRELRVHVRAKYDHGTLRLEPKGVLFFASAPILLRAFLDELAAHPQTERIIVDLSHLGRVDLTGALALKELKREAEGAGLEVELTHAPPQSWRLIRRVMAEDNRETDGAGTRDVDSATNHTSPETDDIPRRSSAHGDHA
jgi:SulP family sulfate permease